MTSLRTRLFAALLVITALVWAVAAGWIYLQTQRDVERVLDARLVEAARMVASLAASGAVSGGTVPPLPRDGYSQQLSCQIWSVEGRLVARSGGAPAERLGPPREGFSETGIGGETWRVYTVLEPGSGLQVSVGDNLRVRDNLVRQVIAGLLLPASAGILALGALIWIVVEQGLAPLRRIARSVAGRSASNLSAIDEGRAVAELRPMIAALNSLFERLSASLQRERHLTASAAHELKTPLAGLKTQAQIALAAEDPSVRLAALAQIAASVDRTTRLVNQLLEMARQDAQQEGAPPPAAWVDMDQLLGQLADELEPLGRPRAIELDVSGEGLEVFASPELLRAALRNLMENAVCYAARRVVVRLAPDADAWTLSVEDDGPGIPAEELPRVRERFFRGRNHVGVGSGLGLSIVDLAVRQAGLILDLRSGLGLRAEIPIPAERVRRRPGGCGRLSPGARARQLTTRT